MAFLKFNKSELVNLDYSLKREIINANYSGTYCNTSISGCNTRRYHGLLAAPVKDFDNESFIFLSSLDETIIFNQRNFNLGIHYYNNIYEPKGYKYIIDFEADPITKITYRIGEIIFAKSLLLLEDSKELLIKYELINAPSKITLNLKPFLAFRNIHSLTKQNNQADSSYKDLENGKSFCLYKGFPQLNIQFNKKSIKYLHNPYWYNDITYSDEYRRGFDCKEDLLVPGSFEISLKQGDSIICSVNIEQETQPYNLNKNFNKAFKKRDLIRNYKDQLVRWANIFISKRNEKKQITAGLSWLYTGLLRESLISLSGMTIFANNNANDFEEILDNLLADEKERLFKRTTQVEAPLRLVTALQDYIKWGADEKKLWLKYGKTVKKIIESYKPGNRKEISLQPNGLLWAEFDNVALSWMNAYINNKPVTERAGYQIETNAFWYNALCFAIDMEKKYGAKSSKFLKDWKKLVSLTKNNFKEVFWNEEHQLLADYVDNKGQQLQIRPNMMFAICLDYSPLDEELFGNIIKKINSELVTQRGIRTLSPRDNQYRCVYEGSQIDRDLAYHQGSTRPFLLADYIEMQFKFLGKSFVKKAEWLIEGFIEDLNKHGVGSFSELYDGDPPHEPHGAIASALSTASLLKIDYLINKYKKEGV